MPDLVTRRALFDRLAGLNEQRYKDKILLYIPHVVGLLDLDRRYSWAAIKKVISEAEITISDDDLREVLKRASHGSRESCKVEKVGRGNKPQWKRVL